MRNVPFWQNKPNQTRIWFFSLLLSLGCTFNVPLKKPHNDRKMTLIFWLGKSLNIRFSIRYIHENARFWKRQLYLIDTGFTRIWITLSKVSKIVLFKPFITYKIFWGFFNQRFQTAYQIIFHSKNFAQILRLFFVNSF